MNAPTAMTCVAVYSEAAPCYPVPYENLALFDALRSGNARERALAQKLFEEYL